MIPISFWGTPSISAVFLGRIYQEKDFKITFCLTQPDKPRSHRGRTLIPSEVKKKAIELGIPVYTPHSLKKEKDMILELTEINQVQFHVILAYGKIIPTELIDSAEKGSVNFHASLLPKLRGAAPIEFALLNGFKQTGWSLQQIKPELDAGDVLACSKIAIDKNDNRDRLYEKLTHDILQNGVGMLRDFAHGKLEATVQENSLATYCGKISTAMAKIDWCQNARSIINLYRAFDSKPGVHTMFRKKRLKLKISTTEFPDMGKKVGEIVEINDKGILVQTGKGCVQIVHCQVEGKKLMSSQSFCNGYKPNLGELFD